MRCFIRIIANYCQLSEGWCKYQLVWLVSHPTGENWINLILSLSVRLSLSLYACLSGLRAGKSAKLLEWRRQKTTPTAKWNPRNGGRACGLKGNFRLTYQDKYFGTFVNLTSTGELQNLGTINVVLSPDGDTAADAPAHRWCHGCVCVRVGGCVCVSVGDAWLCGWGSLRIGLRHVRRAIHSQWVPVVPGNRMTCALSLCVLSFVALGVEICLTLEA